jgi:3-oxoacyl-[acyl-carrier-protein] synthase III
MIAYHDFAPHLIKHGMLHADQMENFDAAVVAANQWLAANGIDPLNIETVVLPNITPDRSEGTNDGRVETEEAMTSVNEWYQFIRVWYRA